MFLDKNAPESSLLLFLYRIHESPSAPMATHELDTKNSEDEKRSPTSEHHEIAGSESIDHSDANGDDALLLVGKERTAEFSEEYNLKLRRKLVSWWGVFSQCSLSLIPSKDLLIPPLCAAVYFTQFMCVYRAYS